MALRDIFKRKPKEKPTEKVKSVVEKVKPAEEPKEVKGEIKAVSKKKVVVGEAYRILKSPHITEKTTDLTKKNQYAFKVYTTANKIDIKKAIEDVYGVNVLNVNIINISSKKRRLGKITGWRKGYKKAIVKIKKGQKIEILPQ
ncbi:50S ribosomal protein L23 [Patescibacteria group bacterium]|nr:50S ribosomal protein L23 [Patescibacteria group bacterium]